MVGTRKWTPEELEVLQRMAGKFPVEAIAAAVDRSPSSIVAKAHQEGVALSYSNSYAHWTTSEDKHIEAALRKKQHVGTLYALIPNHTPNAIRVRYDTMRTTMELVGAIPHFTRRRVDAWSKREDAKLLKAIEQGKTRKQVAKLFPNRTVSAIANRRNQLFNRIFREQLGAQHDI